MKKKYILGIESSCDETAAAVVYDGAVLSNVIASQIEIHKRYGGVVPEVASRNHTLAILNVIDSALNEAKITLDDIDLIAVTSHPGLAGPLMVGVATAQALAFSKNIQLEKVNHVEAHICAVYAEHKNARPPFLAGVASGGHTSIIDVTDYNTFVTVGHTTDDAIGEAFDKVARLLGLPYPGGPIVDKLAKNKEGTITFMRHKGVNPDLTLSYSGLKTAVVNYIHNLKQKDQEIDVENICASFNKEAANMFIDTILEAANRFKRDTIVLAGGVAANTYLRNELTRRARQQVLIPSMGLCTDNAVMVALRALHAWNSEPVFVLRYAPFCIFLCSPMLIYLGATLVRCRQNRLMRAKTRQNLSLLTTNVGF